MSTILWTFILWLGTCAGPASAPSQTPIEVKVGSTAVLPCDWREIPSAQLASSSPHIEWRTNDKTVFERAGAEMFQGEGYEDRADVPEDKLLEGNCSLVLKNVKLDDAGVYKSFLMVRQKKRSLSSKRLLLLSVELLVDDTPEKIYNENNETERNQAIIHTSSWVIHLVLLLFLMLFYIL